MIRRIHIKGYRSLRDFQLKLGRVNVITGGNGTGKSNLYHCLELLTHAAGGGFARRVANEGGMPSLLWSGNSNFDAAKELMIEVEMDDINYLLNCRRNGGGPDDPTLFKADPLIKLEALWAGPKRTRSTTLAERKLHSVTVADGDGNRNSFSGHIIVQESLLSQLQDPNQYPILASARQHFLGWRFYHQFRTDAESPIRQGHIGAWTPVMRSDGSDLASALQTICESGKDAELDAFIEEAFPETRLRIEMHQARFTLFLEKSGVSRDIHAAELSDGTLRLLCLAAALLSPQPPSLMALNEPETSLHPEVLPALARLIAKASERSQIWLVTHSSSLAEMIEETSGEKSIPLIMVDGETRTEKQGRAKRSWVFE